MKLSLIVSLICLSVVGCAATPPPAPLPPQTVTIQQLPPATKVEMVEGSMVIIEEVEVQTNVDPKDYDRLSDLIHREVSGIKCVCAAGDPFCRCKLPNGPKKLPQE